MANRSYSSGQTLVEVALVLPSLCLGVMMTVQLIAFCHNVIELQHMTQLAADSKRANDGARFSTYSLFHGLWGDTSVEKIQIVEHRLLPWRRHRGISTLGDPGSSVEVRLVARSWAGNGLSPAVLRAQAQAYYEPDVKRGQ